MVLAIKAEADWPQRNRVTDQAARFIGAPDTC